VRGKERGEEREGQRQKVIKRERTSTTKRKKGREGA